MKPRVPTTSAGLSILASGLLALLLAAPLSAQSETAPTPSALPVADGVLREMGSPRPGPTTDPGAGVAPGLVWRRAVDSVADPMLADAGPRPLAIAAGPRAFVLVTSDAAGAPGLWHSDDGHSWAQVADLPGVESGAAVNGVTAYAKGWLAHGTDTDGAVVMWSSADGREWQRVADAKLEPFEGATIDGIVAAGDGLFVFGRSAGAAASDRIWSSPNGRRWRERVEFARAHEGATLTAAGPMGNKFVTFGRAGTDKPAVWVGSNLRINYITRQWRGSEPQRPAPPSAFYVGRDGAIAIVDDTPGSEPRVWRSINAGDWRQVDREASSAPGDPPVYATDGELIIADRVSADGRHEISVSTAGETWQAVPSAGEVPTTTAPVLLAARLSEIVVVGSDGIWVGDWTDRSAVLPPRPTFPPPAVGAIGADPPLRPPVTRPQGEWRVLDTTAPPSARSERGGVRLELWLPEGRVRTRDWLPAHVRITNGGTRTITFICGGGWTRAETDGLFPTGKRWSGNAAEFKRRVLDQWSGNLGFGFRQGDGDDCPGSVGLDIELAPGEVYEYDVWTIPRYPVRAQPLPSGRLPVATTFGFRVAGDGTRRLLTARDDVRLVGPRWPWATPQELIDTMLADPRFKDWLDRRDRPNQWSNTTFHLVDKRSFYWTELGFDGPAPDGTVHIGLFAGSWGPFGGGYGRMLLDPWTGQVLGFAT